MTGTALLLLVLIWTIHFYRYGGVPLLFGAITGHYQVA